MRMGGRRGGQALADGRLSGIDRRGDGLCVLREEARRLCRRTSRGVLKRLIDRHPASSRWVLADLGVGWESYRIQQTLLVEKTGACYTDRVMHQDRSVINSHTTVHANVLHV